jgi:xanthosine utilization system XapX-like protein
LERFVIVVYGAVLVTLSMLNGIVMASVRIPSAVKAKLVGILGLSIGSSIYYAQTHYVSAGSWSHLTIFGIVSSAVVFSGVFLGYWLCGLQRKPKRKPGATDK